MSSQQEISNFYQILNVSKDATDKEISRAYQLAVQTYNTNSLAAYSLFSEEESDDILRNITKAYMTLDDPVTRAQYDEEIEKYNLEGWSSASSEKGEEKALGQPSAYNIQNEDVLGSGLSQQENIDDELNLSAEESNATVTLDDKKESVEETDLSSKQPSNSTETPPSLKPLRSFAIDESTASLSQRLEARLNIRSNNREVLNKKNVDTQKKVTEFLSTITQFDGQVLKQIRELKSINLEEIAEETCVRKIYLIAIEEEDYSSLPDTIYIKSFLSNYARCLELPSEQVITDYMNLHQKWPH